MRIRVTDMGRFTLMVWVRLRARARARARARVWV